MFAFSRKENECKSISTPGKLTLGTDIHLLAETRLLKYKE